jgi:hypothetical protein
MGEVNTCRMLDKEPVGKRPLRKSGRRLEDNNTINIKYYPSDGHC